MTDRETQLARVLEMLRAGPVCSTAFLGDYIPRAAARVWDLRQEGREITTRRCRQHEHDTKQIEYVLVEAGQGKLL